MQQNSDERRFGLFARCTENTYGEELLVFSQFDGLRDEEIIAIMQNWLDLFKRRYQERTLNNYFVGK